VTEIRMEPKLLWWGEQKCHKYKVFGAI
jgi:hypothetical protein